MTSSVRKGSRKSGPSTQRPNAPSNPPSGLPRDRRQPFRSPYQLVGLRHDGPLRARVDPTQEPLPEPPSGSGRRPMTFAARSTAGRPPGRWRRLSREYGWRLYAIPALLVATVVYAANLVKPQAIAFFTGPTADQPAAQPARPISKPRATGIFVDSPPSSELSTRLPGTVLPSGGPFSSVGGGRFDVVPGSSRVYGHGPLRRFTIEIEAGVAEDGPAFARAVEKTLGDPHGWGAGGRLSFQRVDSGEVDFRVSLAASMSVRKLCGYTLPYETSCYNGELGRAVINDARWVRGAVAYAGDLDGYRAYVINHEVGHALGNPHQPCPRAGTRAPVMMQQTLSLVTAGVGRCRPNPWPYP